MGLYLEDSGGVSILPGFRKGLDTCSILNHTFPRDGPTERRTTARENYSMADYIPLLVSALGGTILGPIVSRLLDGSGTIGVLGGVIGGIAAHFAADAAAIGPLLGTSAMMLHVQSFIEGGVGGGLIGLIAGLAVKQR